MQTLSYGINKPESGDQGASLFTALSANFQQQNDHSHNGTDSAKLTSTSLTLITQSILAAAWVETPASSGTYKQTVSMPGALQFNEVAISLRDTASGNPLNLTVNKVTGTSFDVFVNDNTLNLTANYGI